MSLNVNAFVADFLKKKYHRSSITVMNGCCRKCLRGTPSGYNLGKRSMEELMNDGEIDAYQIASAFHIGSAFHAPYFKDSVINMKSEAMPCKYPGNCELKCVLCFSLIVNSDDMELDIWPGFRVHKACTSPCIYPGCKKRLPTLPAYLSLQRSTLVCEMHKESSAFKRLSVSSAVCMQERSGSNHDSNAGGIASAANSAGHAVHTIFIEGGARKRQGEAFDSALGTIPVFVSAPAVSKTFSFKKPLGKARADKFDERGKSKSIFNFFHKPTAAEPAKKTATAGADHASNAVREDRMDGAPRRFLRDRETGEIYGEWRGHDAFHIETGEFMFTRRPDTPRPQAKLDFTPPASARDA